MSGKREYRMKLIDDFTKPFERYSPIRTSTRLFFRRFWKPANVLCMPYLPTDYVEPSELLLHSAFESLCVLVEKEKVFERVDFWPAPIPHLPPEKDQELRREWNKRGSEIKALYEWWRIERPKRLDPWTDEALGGPFEGEEYHDSDEPGGFTRRGEDGEVYQATMTDEYREHLEKHALLEAAQEEEDDAMLMRLVVIRRDLWS